MDSRSACEGVLAGAEPSGLRVVLGRAFLVALNRSDRETAMVFARALLTQFPAAAQVR
jgi:hypothetical protein